jgi:hypothetical protein
VLALIAAVASGSGTARGSDSARANVYASLQQADNELGKVRPPVRPAESPLTIQDFAALSKIGGFTSAGYTEIATRVREEVLANRRTAAKARAALRTVNPAANQLALVDAETTTANHTQRGALAFSLFNVANDEATYWKTVATEAELSARIAAVFTTKAAVDRAWARKVKKGAFASQKAARSAYRREITKALAPADRLMSRENVLQRRAHRAPQTVASDLFSLRIALRDYPDARRTAKRLRQDDSKGFFAQGFERSN